MLSNSVVIEGKVFNNLNVPGVDNCFFSCLSLSLHGNLSMSINYKNIIAHMSLKTGIHGSSQTFADINIHIGLKGSICKSETGQTSIVYTRHSHLSPHTYDLYATLLL